MKISKLIQSEFIIISKIEFYSDENKEAFIDLLVRLCKAVNSKISSLTPDFGITDATSMDIPLPESAIQCIKELRQFLMNSDISNQELTWFANEVAIGHPPEGLMLSFPCTVTVCGNTFHTVQKILKSAGAMRGKTIKLSRGNEEAIIF